MVDCQATAAAPRGHLLEIGWARVLGTTITHAHASLIALPDGEQISPAVARITGISEHMMRSAVDGRCAWRELTTRPRVSRQPAPTVIHFARFEQPFLRTLAAGVFPLDVVCTRDIARRLLPNLPRCSLRALAGYFGRAVGALRRAPITSKRPRSSGTSWSACSRQGVSTWGALRLARRTCHTDQVPTPHLADAAGRAAFIADCAWDLSHASDGRQRPTSASRVAASSGQQLLSEAGRRARAVARDAVAGTRDLVRRHTKSARGRIPRAG